MGEFLTNMIKALEFVLHETPSREVIRILTERIRYMFESSVVERDIDNFIAYFRVLISGKHTSRMLTFNRKLVHAFITRTDTGIGGAAIDFRTDNLYTYLSGKIKNGAQITDAHLARVHEEFSIMKMPSLDKIIENIRVAMILKWLQSPMMHRFSHDLQDYIVVLATVYGECRKNVVMNVEWPTLVLTQGDKDILSREYRIFRSAISEAVETFKEARARNPDASNYEEQFQVVFNSLDRLAHMDESGDLDSAESFKDRVIVSASLIYVQDDYVVKNDKLRQLIQLFVSMYIKYRDKRRSPKSN
ncbi:MAG: hypothetical protein PVI51_08955 [candidate division WOR-3 bacterium]|jgi:cation transport regulator ChaB